MQIYPFQTGISSHKITLTRVWINIICKLYWFYLLCTWFFWKILSIFEIICEQGPLLRLSKSMSKNCFANYSHPPWYKLYLCTHVNTKQSDTVLNKMFEDFMKECELELVILLGDIKFVHWASYNERLFEWRSHSVSE